MTSWLLSHSCPGCAVRLPGTLCPRLQRLWQLPGAWLLLNAPQLSTKPWWGFLKVCQQACRWLGSSSSRALLQAWLGSSRGLNTCLPLCCPPPACTRLHQLSSALQCWATLRGSQLTCRPGWRGLASEW